MLANLGFVYDYDSKILHFFILAVTANKIIVTAKMFCILFGG